MVQNLISSQSNIHRSKINDKIFNHFFQMITMMFTNFWINDINGTYFNKMILKLALNNTLKSKGIIPIHCAIKFQWSKKKMGNKIFIIYQNHGSLTLYLSHFIIIMKCFVIETRHPFQNLVFVYNSIKKMMITALIEKMKLVVHINSYWSI